MFGDATVSCTKFVQSSWVIGMKQEASIFCPASIMQKYPGLNNLLNCTKSTLALRANEIAEEVIPGMYVPRFTYI